MPGILKAQKWVWLLVALWLGAFGACGKKTPSEAGSNAPPVSISHSETKKFQPVESRQKNSTRSTTPTSESRQETKSLFPVQTAPQTLSSDFSTAKVTAPAAPNFDSQSLVLSNNQDSLFRNQLGSSGASHAAPPALSAPVFVDSPPVLTQKNTEIPSAPSLTANAPSSSSGTSSSSGGLLNRPGLSPSSGTGSPTVGAAIPTASTGTGKSPTLSSNENPALEKISVEKTAPAVASDDLNLSKKPTDAQSGVLEKSPVQTEPATKSEPFKIIFPNAEEEGSSRRVASSDQGILGSLPVNQDAQTYSFTEVGIGFPGAKLTAFSGVLYLLSNLEKGGFTGDLEAKFTMQDPETGERVDCLEACQHIDLYIRVIQCGTLTDQELLAMAPNASKNLETSLHDFQMKLYQEILGIKDVPNFEFSQACNQPEYRDFKVGPDRKIPFANYPLQLDGIYMIEFLPPPGDENRAAFEPFAFDAPVSMQNNLQLWRANQKNPSKDVTVRVLPQLKSLPANITITK